MPAWLIAGGLAVGGWAGATGTVWMPAGTGGGGAAGWTADGAGWAGVTSTVWATGGWRRPGWAGAG